MLLRVVILLTIVGLAAGAVAVEYLPKNQEEPDHKDGCHIQDLNVVIPFGEILTPIGSCQRILCSDELITYHTCGAVVVRAPGCFVTDTDKTLTYPSCCPRIKCEPVN